MFDRLARRRRNRRQWREAAKSFNAGELPAALMPHDRYFVRRLTFESVVRGHNDSRDMVTRAVLYAEIERRNAWAAPAGRAYWISLAALVVAIVAIVVTVAKH